MRVVLGCRRRSKLVNVYKKQLDDKHTYTCTAECLQLRVFVCMCTGRLLLPLFSLFFFAPTCAFHNYYAYYLAGSLPTRVCVCEFFVI